MWSKQNVHIEKQACYLVTFNTVDWVDIFVRPVYKQVIVHSLNHFIDSKGLLVYSWCLMTSHLDLVAQPRIGHSIEEIEKKFRHFTNEKILEAIDTEPPARKEWMLKRFELSAYHDVPTHEIWQNPVNRGPIDLSNTSSLLEYVECVHEKPVKDRFVDRAADYLYSSARDYAGTAGLVNIFRHPEMEQWLPVSDNFKGAFYKSVQL